MADALARLKDEIESVRRRASAHRKAAKEEGTELLMDLGVSALAGLVGAAEGKDKIADTFEAFGYQVPTKLTAALVAKGIAYATKGTMRKAANESGRALLVMASYAGAKTAAQAP